MNIFAFSVQHVHNNERTGQVRKHLADTDHRILRKEDKMALSIVYKISVLLNPAFRNPRFLPVEKIVTGRLLVLATAAAHAPLKRVAFYRMV